MATQFVAAFGSIVILASYGAIQLGRLGPQNVTYGALNLVGSVALSAAAIIASQWGFLLLEGTWALISLAGVLRLMRTRYGAKSAS